MVGADTGVNTQDFDGVSKKVCVLTFPDSAPITGDVTLSNDAIYALNGAVFVGNGIGEDGTDAGDDGNLTIEAGTTIVGTAGAGFEDATAWVEAVNAGAADVEVSDSDVDYMVVKPGSNIFVEGTASAPVIMTGVSDLTGEVRAGSEAQWGGFVVSGLATQNNCNEADLGTAACVANGEGASGYYGGTDDEDSSGSIEYLQVKYAGYKFSNEDELNGIAFQAVGSGTVLDYIQVHNGSDDGIEFFGGTAGIKHFVVTGASDDSLDWTDGWRGFAQYGVIVQTLFPATDAARSKDNVIEADNYGSDMDRAPRSFPKMANITMVQDYGGDTLLLREGTGAFILNSIIAGNPDDSSYCLDVDDNETYRHAGTAGNMTNISFDGTIFDSVKCSAMAASSGWVDPSSSDEGADVFDIGAELESLDSVMFNATGLHGSKRNAAYLSHPLVNSYHAGKIANANVLDSNLVTEDFIGGVKSDAEDWTVGWTYGLHISNADMQDFCPLGTALTTIKDGGGAACEITATNAAETNIRLVGGGLPYVMKGKLVVGDGTAAGAQYLQVDPGVTIYSDQVAGEGSLTDLDYVVVPTYSKLLVNGAPGAPVTFTSSREVRTSGDSDSSTLSAETTNDWGGLVINGLATQNKCNISDIGTADCTADGEGASGSYGGTNDADNSGNIFYGIVKYAGRKFNNEDELNGVAFQAVGNKTEIDYMQTFNTSDDGVEFFGGTVNAKHLLVMSASDDSIDWTDGWRGKVQHAIVWQNQGQEFAVDRSIEADNYGSDMDRTPRSMPMFANLTIVSQDGQAVLLREGTGLNIYNSVVADEGASTCWDIDDATTYDFNADGVPGEGHVYRGNLFSCTTLAQDDDSGANVAQIEALLSSDTNTASAGGGSLSGYCNGSVESGLTPVAIDDAFFDSTDYVGACASADTDWTLNWAFKPSE